MPVYTINTRSGPSYRYLVTNYQYDRGSALRGVNGAGGPPGYIQGGYCTTDALGRPVKQSSYNNTTTTNSYHPLTHRLTRQLTTRSSDNRTVQDFRYFYDAAGNITLRRDEAQQAVFYANTIAYPENDYTYDALYRLIKAGGREHAGSNAATSWNDSTRMGTNTQPLLSDETAMRPYIQYYEYDEAGNMVRMRHTTTGGTGNWTRSFITDSGSNRMTGMWMGTTMPASPDESYSYDGRGNMLDGMSHLQSMGYNELSQLEHLSINSTRDGYYQYNGDGQRWRKTVIGTSGGVTTKEERCYQTGGVEEYIKTVGGSITLERQTHRIQGAGANVLIERRLAGTGGGEAAEMVRYQYGDQLNSCGLELDETGDVISYEEYYPFGSTSFQSGRTTAEVSLKRYRYTGKERDEESGLNYHGARYYAPWLCRWTQVDPKQAERSTLSPYNYCQNDPVNRVDMDGMKDEKKSLIVTQTASNLTPNQVHDNPEGRRQLYTAPVPPAPPALLPPSKSALVPKTQKDRFAKANPIKEPAKSYQLPFMEMKPTPKQTPEEAEAQKKYTEDRYMAEGYYKDGSKPPLMQLGENKRFQGFSSLFLTSVKTYMTIDGLVSLGSALTTSEAIVGGTAPIMRGGGQTSGQAYAASITEGGTGKAFAGHGTIRFGSGTTIVPEGTSITMWTGQGFNIKNSMGKLIEAGDYQTILDNSTYIMDMENGAVTHLPGAEIPNLTLAAPKDLSIMSKSMTVEDATHLNLLLQPNMGRIDWAACLENVYR